MPISNGQQWCHFTSMYWILKYFQHTRCSLHIWNKKNGKIIVKVRNQNEDDSLNIGYIDNHFKLAKDMSLECKFPKYL